MKDLAAAMGTGQLPVHQVQKGTSQKTARAKITLMVVLSKVLLVTVVVRKATSLKLVIPPTNANPHNKSPKTSKPQHSLQADSASESTEASYTLFHIDNQNHPPINVNFSINEHESWTLV